MFSLPPIGPVCPRPPPDRKQLAEEEQRELEEFRDACQLPQSEGVAYAVEKMAVAQADVKEQFKEVFLELRESLEVCKGRIPSPLGQPEYTWSHESDLPRLNIAPIVLRLPL